jgi:CRP-like cAMP-binding protein
MAPTPAGFLAALPPEDQEALRAAATVRRYDRGVALFHAGDDAGVVLVLVSGRVKVTSVSSDGKEVVLGVRGPGDLVGELSAVDGAPRSATAVALEPVEALGVPGARFTALLGQRPGVALALLRLVTARLREADVQRLELAAVDVLGRVARRLVELADRFGSATGEGVEIELALSQEELAAWAGSSREAVSKALLALRTLGWVETHRRRIVVRDMDALRRHAA